MNNYLDPRLSLVPLQRHESWYENIIKLYRIVKINSSRIQLFVKLSLAETGNVMFIFFLKESIYKCISCVTQPQDAVF